MFTKLGKCAVSLAAALAVFISVPASARVSPPEMPTGNVEHVLQGDDDDLSMHRLGVWEGDDVYHWQWCSTPGCPGVEEYGEHEFENGECTICGYKHKDHTYPEKYTLDGTTLTRKCTVCNYVETVEHSCTGYYETRGEQTHVFITNCEEHEPMTGETMYHDYFQVYGKVSKLPDATYVCSKCGHSHTHEWELVVIEDPTKYYCVSCGSQCEYIPPDPVEHEDTHELEYTDDNPNDETGHTIKCSVTGCNFGETANQPHDYSEKNGQCKLCGHTHTAHKDADADCKCDVCGAHVHNYIDEDVDDEQHCTYCVNTDGRCTEPKIFEDHDFKNGECIFCHHKHVAHKDADNNGECDICGAEVPVHVHNGGDAWQSDETQHWHECTADGCSLDGGKYDVADHSYVTHESGTVLTHNLEGFTCTVCGQSHVHMFVGDTVLTCSCGATFTLTEPESGGTGGTSGGSTGGGSGSTSEPSTPPAPSTPSRPSRPSYDDYDDDYDYDDDNDDNDDASEPTDPVETVDPVDPVETVANNTTTDVQTDEGMPHTAISTPIDSLVGMIFSDDELAEIGNSNVEVILNVKGGENAVPTADKNAVEDVISGSDYILGKYFDITLLATVDGDETKITETNGEVTLVVDIPGDLLGEGRTYYMIRVHDGETDILQDLDNVPETITFMTDKFSTYVLVYQEQAGSSEPSESSESSEPSKPADSDSTESALPGIPDSTPTEDNNPKTGIAYSVIPAILLAGGGALAISKKRSKK